MGLYICLKLNISLVVYVLMATESYSLKANLVRLTESQLFFPAHGIVSLITLLCDQPSLWQRMTFALIRVE